jgi:hypothetical protein
MLLVRRGDLRWPLMMAGLLYVRNLTRAYHRKKIPTLLFKLDITKAFDTTSWEYLLELLQKRGFLAKWMNWLNLILIRCPIQWYKGSVAQASKRVVAWRPLIALLFYLGY